MMHIPHLFQQCLQRGNIFRFRFPNQQKIISLSFGILASFLTLCKQGGNRPQAVSSLQQDTVYLTTLISLRADLLRRQTGLRGVFSRPVLQDGRQHRDTPHPSRGMQLP